MIKFNSGTTTVTITPEMVIAVDPADSRRARIYTCKEEFVVDETDQEVARKIMEYKLAMADYTVYMKAWTTETRNDWKEDHYAGIEFSKSKLMELAGLEQTP